MDQQHVRVATSRQVERLAGTDSDHLDLDPDGCGKLRQEIAEQP
jgi:hypothetical protein